MGDTTTALPPYTKPLRDALDAMKALQGRLAGVEAREASSATEIAPLTTALEDALASGAEADDGALVELEREHRRAMAEAAGLRRLIETQRSVVRAAMAECQKARQTATDDAKKPLEGRLKAAGDRVLGVMAEIQALYLALGMVHEAQATSTIRIPTNLYAIPDPGLWKGVTGLSGDLNPMPNDAVAQLMATATLIEQAQRAITGPDHG